MDVVAPSIIVLAGLGAVFGVGLAYASRAFAVSVDPRVDAIAEALPGANCGACGFAGCAAYAEAVATAGAATGECIPGGPETSATIARVMGVEAEVREERVAVVHCRGVEVASRFGYDGISDCLAASLLQGGFKACGYGCLGLGSCATACPFDAVRMEDGLPAVDVEKCMACGKCVDACPRGIVALHLASADVQVFCRSMDKGGAVRKMCSVGCIGCKKCEKACDVDAIGVGNFLAAVDDEKCVQCGKCVEACPTKAAADCG